MKNRSLAFLGKRRYTSVLPRVRWSIRDKVMSLLVVSLMGMTMALLIFSYRHMVQDRVTQLLEFELSLVKSAAQSMDRQLFEIQQLNQILDQKAKLGSWTQVDTLFLEHKKLLGLTKLLVLEVDSEGAYRILHAQGEDAKGLILFLEQLGWDGQRLLSDLSLVGKASSQELLMGHLIKDGSGGGLAFFEWITPALGKSEELLGLKLILFNALGQYVPEDALSSLLKPEELKRTSQMVEDQKSFTELLEHLIDQQILFGVRDWELQDQKIMLSYQRLAHEEMMVLGVYPYQEALDRPRNFVFRLVFLAIAVMLLTLGLGALIFRQMTSSLQLVLRGLTELKEKGRGIRLDTSQMSGDEVGSLMTSFNMLAVQNERMLDSVREEGRTEVRSDIVAAIRRQWFGLMDIATEKCVYHVSSLPAEPYGGDAWWVQQRTHSLFFLLIEQPDQTSTQAALNMVGFFGALYQWMLKEGLLTKLDQALTREDLQRLVSAMNEWVLANFQGKRKIGAMFVQFQYETGEMELINCDSGIPRVYQCASKQLEMIPVTKFPALGEAQSLEPKVDSFQLLPGDLALWVTSGVFRMMNPKGLTVGSTKVYEWLAELGAAHLEDLPVMGGGYQGRLAEFFGPAMTPPSMDITLLLLKRKDDTPPQAVVAKPDEAAVETT
jgi:hypothetical protein